MIGPDAIRRMNREAQEAAVLDETQPTHTAPFRWRDWLDDYDEGKMPAFPFPHLPDDYMEGLSEDYGHLESFFVDSSGFGSEDEAALTVRQFILKAMDLTDRRLNTYWCISSAGQFQVHIEAYKKYYKRKDLVP